jgi:hypothetical protein
MTLVQLWDLLRGVCRLSFVATSAASTGWNGRGAGTVTIEVLGADRLIFAESGTWRPEGGAREVRFHNVYRWTLAGDVLRLEHLRFGEANPVHLFDLVQCGEREWRPASPHLCREDCYSAVLVVSGEHIILGWEVNGPRKREMIEYVYAGDQEECT